jgi:hypothetical protein
MHHLLMTTCSCPTLPACHYPSHNVSLSVNAGNSQSPTIVSSSDLRTCGEAGYKLTLNAVAAAASCLIGWTPGYDYYGYDKYGESKHASARQ